MTYSSPQNISFDHFIVRLYSILFQIWHGSKVIIIIINSKLNCFSLGGKSAHITPSNPRSNEGISDCHEAWWDKCASINRSVNLNLISFFEEIKVMHGRHFTTNKNSMLFDNEAETYGMDMVCQFHCILEFNILKISSNNGDWSILKKISKWNLYSIEELKRSFSFKHDKSILCKDIRIKPKRCANH